MGYSQSLYYYLPHYIGGRGNIISSSLFQISAQERSIFIPGRIGEKVRLVEYMEYMKDGLVLEVLFQNTRTDSRLEYMKEGLVLEVSTPSQRFKLKGKLKGIGLTSGLEYTLSQYYWSRMFVCWFVRL